ncbi:hypothetical protein [Actinomadura sp. NEAU-AAG7]|uniref:hypothetical protein n=1 Tax=Actinomadura sp. NEAU-AAG7 TaxID=2839640 RepID=UPI001BE44BB5|nr:hypothetical protein [Actinomadura sp. NEAU-AAG7]MBT2213486.1 hypothetical protein [Actinomadura sp. NEAU-AAG7]
MGGQVGGIEAIALTSRKDIDQLIKRINDTPGYVVPDDRTSSSHRRAYRADAHGQPVGHGVTLPGTPSDHNQLHTTRRKLRRHLGWNDPIANNHQHTKKKRRTRGQQMPRLGEIAKVRFDDGTSVSTVPPAPSPTPKPAEASATTRTTRPAAPERPPIGKATVRDAARYMWWHLQTKAAAHPKNATTHAGKPGWRWAGRIGDEMREVYPELSALSKADFNYLLNRVRAILVESGRLVSIKAGNPVVPSVYFIQRDQGVPAHTAVPATVAPTPAAPAPPAVSAPTGAMSDTDTSGRKGVTSTAPDLARNDAQNSRRISVEDLLGFLGEHDTLLQERREVERFAVEVMNYSEQLTRAATALLERLRGERHDGPM